ncbi:MAG: hypothetical protein DMF24_10895 [Verrucomicrobia bacterium]|nr:MAG: hypothetical protein DMF24_10895 [Verrucomicrobiota bacterium]
MGFLTEHCPNCGKAISKEAEYCSSCGCPSATSWTTCNRCQSAIGGDSQFCWKCGAEQDPKARKSFYGDRWHRSPTDFAVRVDLAVPKTVLHHGIQVDEGTLALLFQNGEFKGTLGPGYHSLNSFFERLAGLDKGKEAHAILLDTLGAEVDFEIDNVPVKNQVPVAVRVRLLFQLKDPKLFADKFLQGAASFSTQDVAEAFKADVAQALQRRLKDLSPDDLIIETEKRQLIEKELMESLNPTLAKYGIESTGVRLADFAGAAIDYIRDKLGDISRLNREFELNRRLRDAVRTEKVDAFRDEEQLRDYYEQVSHEFGFKSAEREQERRRFMQIAEHRFQLEGLGQDYEVRRAEILNRLDEQKLTHRNEIVDVQHQLQIHRAKFEEDFYQNQRRFGASLEQQHRQAITDRKVGEEGLALLRQTVAAKLQAREAEEDLALKVEAKRLQMRGDASMKALLSTLSGEQADRVLKLAELEMQRGATAHQALALVFQSSPDIPPALADALKARLEQPAAEESGERQVKRLPET